VDLLARCAGQRLERERQTEWQREWHQ
jgi:hypothetical protein